MSLSAVRIEDHYRAVAARMATLPVFNPALSVEMLGWSSLEGVGHWGVLITPWCMNLFWLPEAGMALPPAGELLVLTLPSGEYECRLQVDARLGPYASASLCSPMQDFASQTQAREMAGEVLRLLGTPPAPPPSAAVSRRALLRRAFGATA